MVNIVESMINQGKIKDRLPNFLKDMVFVLNTHCQVHHNKMVLLKGKIVL